VTRVDVAIAGSGFGGSILARALRRQGLSVALIERGSHPRFALGESSTPLAALSLDRLAARYRMDDLHALAAHGRWRTGLPGLSHGLKRGFTFYDHQRGNPAGRDRAALLVAASPGDAVADSHWLRSDVDAYLVDRAAADGALYLEATEIEGVEQKSDGVELRLAGGTAPRRLAAGCLVDGSGRGGLVRRALGVPDGPPTATRSSLLYGHFRDVATPPAVAGAPYPPHWAAVHHLVAPGWLYELRFDDGLVSAGALLRQAPAGDAGVLWRDLLAAHPALDAAFRAATPVVGPRRDDALQHRMGAATGPGWVALPHTFAFVDPLFSTGIAWTLRAVERLAELLPRRLAEPDDTEGLRRYEETLRREADAIDALIRGAYAAMPEFELFAAYSMVYFAAVSWAEARERLTDLAAPAWECLLGGDDAVLRSALNEAVARVCGSELPDAGAFWRWVADRLAPRDVLGIERYGRGLRVPVDLELLVERAGLLGLSSAEITARLPRLR
jgi:tetracycline 7-halogenase / FADH2 O2-dependent halogenase